MAYTLDTSIITAEELGRIAQISTNLFGIYDTASGAVTTNAGLTVNVAAITLGIVNGTYIAGVSATTQTMATAHATLNRIDTVWVNTSGTIGTETGTPLADPVPVTLGDTKLALAYVKVASEQTVLASSDLIDKRLIASPLSAWMHIDTQVLTATATSISFASINAAFKAFRVSAYILATAGLSVHLRLNNDSGNNYEYEKLSGTGATAAAAVTTGAAQIVLDTVAAIDLDPGTFEVTVFKPVATKLARVHSLAAYSSSANTPVVDQVVGGWLNTADLINRIDLLASASTFAANTRVTLEGMVVLT